MPDEKQKRFLTWSEGAGGYVISQSIRKLALMSPETWVERCNSGKFPDEWVHHHNIAGKDARMLVTDGPLYIDDQQVLPAKVPTGIYELGLTGDGDALLKKHSLSPDEYVNMSDALSSIIQETTWFLNSKEAYDRLGMTWRRGLLIYGPPGNGKTRVIMEAAKQFSDRARIIVVPDVQLAQAFRPFLSDMPSICVIEEITEAISEDGAQDFLNFLDGVEAWPNCITIATTNYPEKLEPNMVDRPSRFDRLYLIDNPTPEARRTYLERFFDPGEVTEDVIESTSGMSVAYLKELVVQHKLQGKSLFDVLDDYHERKKMIKKAFKKAEDRAGF